jgi:hypothetical protein
METKKNPRKRKSEELRKQAATEKEFENLLKRASKIQRLLEAQRSKKKRQAV